MKVVIFCGGMGTRLKEETEFKPKPMVLIGDRPILWHILRSYAHYGYKDSILCLGYKGEKIKEYFYHYETMANDFQISLGQKDSLRIHHQQNEVNWNITLANTGEKALKGARLKKIEKYVDSEHLLVTYGDGVLISTSIGSLSSICSMAELQPSRSETAVALRQNRSGWSNGQAIFGKTAVIRGADQRRLLCISPQDI